MRGRRIAPIDHRLQQPREPFIHATRNPAHAGRLLRPRQPDEYAGAQPPYDRVGAVRSARTSTARHRLRVSALVHSRHGGHGHAATEDDSRFRRLSQGAVRGPDPAPGDPALASRVRHLLAPTEVLEDTSVWGLDHGTWSVLQHVYPNADVPVVQLSIDGTKSLADHYELGRRLAPLRDEGVLVVGSGNVVHNLGTVAWEPGATPFPWATRFNEAVRSRLLANDHAILTDMSTLGEDGARSIPTPEHYLPLLYVIALQRPEDRVEFLTDGIELGSISMLSVSIGSM